MSWSHVSQTLCCLLVCLRYVWTFWIPDETDLGEKVNLLLRGVRYSNTISAVRPRRRTGLVPPIDPRRRGARMTKKVPLVYWVRSGRPQQKFVTVPTTYFQYKRETPSLEIPFTCRSQWWSRTGEFFRGRILISGSSLCIPVLSFTFFVSGPGS